MMVPGSTGAARCRRIVSVSEPVTRDQLIGWFEQACTPERRVGLEWEKTAARTDGESVRFDDVDGIESMLIRLADRFDWTPVHEQDRVIALKRDGSNITLEPGGQIELSTTPHETLAGIERELRRHLAELQDVTRGSDILFLQVGFTPFAEVSNIPFVPKGRYGIMKRYLGPRGDLAHAMMKGTSSVQVTLDYASEADCARKLRVVAALSPVVTALAAASPLASGRPTGARSFRARCWRSTNPDRTGLRTDLFGPGFTFERWVDWVLQVPMMFVERGGRYLDATGKTFADWMRFGLAGERPTFKDWELHLTSVFPEVRLKNFIEVRGADNGPLPHVLGIGALWKGLLYDGDALEEALTVAEALASDRRDELLDLAIAEGLSGRWEGRSLRAWAGYILEIASAGLSRQAPDGPAEVAYLAPLVEMARAGRSYAADILDAADSSSGRRALLSQMAYPAVVRIPPVAPSAGLWGTAELRSLRR